MAPDPKRNKEAEEARLRALQMADLGTARREYISTTDDTRQRIAAMGEIERHRHSNIAGTVEQRRAQQNQASLSAWTNFHRTAADTGRVEQLDDLMHGQSHRAQLNASLHGNEVPRHPAETLSMLVHTSRLLAGQPDEILRWIPIIQMIQPPVQLEAGRHNVAIVVETPTPLIGPDCPRSDRENLHPHLHPPNARASFPLPSVSSGASSGLPSKPPTVPKAMAPKPAMTPNRATTPKLVMTPKAAATPKVMAPNHVIAPKPVMTPQSAVAPKPATNPKAVQKSSLADSMFATPASSTPVASAAEHVPGSSTPSRRTVPLEKTAGFSSRAKAARPKPSDKPRPIYERQKGKEREEPTAVLLDIDEDEEVNAETETHIRNLLLTPGMAELTGITFPTEDESHLFSSDDVQAYIAQQILELLGNCSGYLQDRVGSSRAAHLLDPILGPLKATSLGVIEAISKKVVEEIHRTHLKALRPPEEEAAPGPSTPAPSQDQRLALRKTESVAPELETDQLGKTSIFDNYRTPPRSASATVTDSSDEKEQRNIDAASFLSPKKRVVPPDLPTMEFESLRVSEGGNVRTAPGEPLSLLDMDINPTPSKQVIAKTATKPPILGSMESPMFAAPSNAPYQLNKAKAGTTSEENTTISKAPRGAPVSQTIVRSEGPSRSVSEVQRPTLVQSSSNIRKEASAKGASPRAESSSPPHAMKSRVLSGGIEHSKWADPALIRPAPFSTPQAQPQQRPRTELMSSRHSSIEDSTKPKVTLLGPPPYMPKRK
ncbi:uncharacterized protein N7473_005484 [Penicillium subrubescens]|uniref:uncharacterized protein n=1 Tax=Penicillium subrubescens TaxID=1316194 RepID=UPI0025452A97|nr:uncharacterized protein N7473_005484 [Penicillium subrubescens]KAJ5896085.1 hypothetical protein N7473_005484 [Penicillium subrubescens]